MRVYGLLATVFAFCFGSSIGQTVSGASEGRTGPVEITLAVKPETISPGQEAELTLTLKIAPSWHIYAESDLQTPLELKLDLPKGVEPVGAWVRPESSKDSSGSKIYEGEQVFRQRLSASTAGDLVLKLTASYQACNPRVCLAPESLEISTKLKVKSSAR